MVELSIRPCRVPLTQNLRTGLMAKERTFLPEHFLSEMRSVEQSGHSCLLRQVDLGYNAKNKEADVHSFIL